MKKLSGILCIGGLLLASCSGESNNAGPCYRCAGTNGQVYEFTVYDNQNNPHTLKWEACVGDSIPGITIDLSSDSLFFSGEYHVYNGADQDSAAYACEQIGGYSWQTY